MPRSTCVEPLESRRLLSVTAASLTFPLTAGTHFTTMDNDGSTDSVTVIGSATFNGHSGTKVTDQSTSDGDVSTSNLYIGFDSGKNLVTYGADIFGSDYTATDTYNPPHLAVPAVMVAGQTYSSSTTLSVDTDADGIKSAQETSTYKLESDARQSITVPAGTFKCYQITETDSFTITNDGKTVTTTSTVTDYVALGFGTIKSVQVNDGDVSTTVLTSTNVKTPAKKLAFDVQPSGANVGVALVPAVKVDVEDIGDDIVATDTSNVTLTVASGPKDGLSGTTTVAAVKGVATFSNLKFTKPGTYTLIAADAALDTATSTTFVIKGTGSTKLHFGVEPSPANTDTAIKPAVTVEIDSDDGTVNTKDTTDVTLAIESGPVGGVIVGTTTQSAVKGVATFADLSFDIPGTYTLLATDGDLDSAVSTSFTIISKAKATKLAFAVQPATTVAGKAISPSVKVNVEFSGGAIVQTDTSTVTLALASGPGKLGGTLTAKAVNGVATFSNLLLTTAGAYTFTATDAALTAATSNKFTITAAAAAKLAFVATPPKTVAGKAITPGVAVSVLDTYGNVVTADTSKITIALATGTGTLAGTTTVAAKAGVATFSTLSLAKAGTYSFKATDAKLTSATSGTFTITSAAATKLVLVSTLAATTVAGKAISPAVVVDLEDALGNIVTTDVSKVTIAVATGGGTFTGTAVATAKAGVATFSNLILTLAGAYTFKATDGTLTAALSKSFTVTAAAASKVVFAAALPPTVTAGKAISPAVVANVEDQFGNVVKTDASKITMAVSTGPTAATLGGTVTATAKAGVATFSNLTLTKAGAYTLKATDGALATAKSSSITVAAAAAAKLVFTAPPTAVKKNTSLSPSVSVAVEDAFGNVVTTDKSKVTIALATHPSGAVLSGTAAIAAVNGVAVFSGLKLSTAGTYSLKVTDGVLTSATSASFAVT